jgi:misacylated tRNA(Ala) deacylase
VLLLQRREGVQQRLPVGPPEVLRFVVNAVAYRSFGALITGVQIGPDRSRIDFKLAGFSREQAPDFEERVNAVIARGLPLGSSIIDEEEYRRRPELIRTLNVLPPVVDGRVRFVEIEGFDAQACGGTHVHSTLATEGRPVGECRPDPREMNRV